MLLRTPPLDHATSADRAAYREQLATLAERYPAHRERLLGDLDPVERRAVEAIVTIRGLLPVPPEAVGAETELLRVEALGDGGRVAYLGRPDGVYSLTITAAGGVLPLEPHAPWSKWRCEAQP